MITFLTLSPILAIAAVSIIAVSLYKYFSLQDDPRNEGEFQVVFPAKDNKALARTEKEADAIIARQAAAKQKTIKIAQQKLEMRKRERIAQKAAVRQNKF